MMKNLLLLLGALAGVGSVSCQSSGIGDPCIHEREHDPNFSGFSTSEIDVESRSFQCKSRVCLVANFQGRASCPYGQPENYATLGADERCYLPGTQSSPDLPGAACTNCVNALVEPQKIVRPPETAMYCSCRCDGPDSNVRYCECPSGYSCERLISNFGAATGGQLVGSYCIKEGTKVDDPGALANEQECEAVIPRPDGCGINRHPAGL